eukprot:13730593-Heterocapsa_arctica.AAC.1
MTGCLGALYIELSDCLSFGSSVLLGSAGTPASAKGARPPATEERRSLPPQVRDRYSDLI